MKKLLLILAIAAIAFTAEAKPRQEDKRATELNVATYNVWGNRQRHSLVNREKKAPSERLWENSRDAVAQLIVDADWDIFGVQEGGNLVREELPKLVKEKGGKYKWWFQRPDPSISDKEDTKNLANGMVWRSDRFKVSNKKVYWLSPTPDTPSKAWEEKIRHWRFVMSATVKDKKSGLEFIFMVTHCPLMKSVNEKCAKLIVEREKIMNPKDKVVIFVGDMNSRLNSPYTQIIRTHFTDTRDIAKEKSAISGTMNGAEVRETPKDYTIDYVYIRGSELDYEVSSHKVYTDRYMIGKKLLFPSDHCPVGAKIKLSERQ
ncbi:MAG: endonuclease/exonuclease/phosphatase family protein [Alistipes sp.]|nr:endonuclease/exonuclease/phosphatase family protein [Alistipes sp.]MBQ3026639.1 endonuclease/exonuclease/phosphatase family protein [Alistipes sp.]